MSYYKQIFHLLALLMVAIPVMATPIKGTVLDSYGYPLQGVVVHIKGEKSGVVTGSDGSFSIDAVAGTILIVEHPGFNVSEIKARSGAPMLVRLPERFLKAALPLAIMTEARGDTIYVPYHPEPMIDVLYGRVRQQSFIGAVSTIGASQLSTTPASSYTYALPGRLAGLNVQQISGFYSPLTGSLTSHDYFVGDIPNNTSGAGPTDNTEFNIQLRGHNASIDRKSVV